MSANVNSMFAVGEKPWHGLGTMLTKEATAAEAITAAGLDWRVTKEPIYLASGKPVADKFATVRDNGTALGVVGKRYTVLQNKEAFSLFDAVVGEKLAMYHTAGSLGEGERVWILAKLPGTIKVVGEDVVEKFLLLYNSHDGTSAVEMMFTPIRVVCQNTLNMALGEATNRASVKHTKAMGMRVTNIRERLGIINSIYADFGEAAQHLAKVQVNGEAWRTMLRDIGITPADENATLSTRTQNIVNALTDKFEGSQRGGTWDGVRGTAWGAFNAVAEYADFERTVKGKNKDEQRAFSLLFGSGADLKQKAWDAALAVR